MRELSKPEGMEFAFRSPRLFGVSALAAFALALAAPTVATAQGKNVDLENTPVGVPLGSATMKKPWKIEFATPPAMAGGKPVINTVVITDLPAQKAGESIEDASKRKADTIAAEVNKVLPMVNGQPAASVTQMNVKIIIGINPPVFAGKPPRLVAPATPIFGMAKQSFLTVKGLYSVPDTKGKPGSGTPAVKQLTNPTKEYGDGLKLVPGQPGSTTPYSGSMSGSSTSATGMDPTGAQSFVYFGIDGVGLGGDEPTAGESDFLILQSISAQLDLQHIQNHFDSSTDTLYLTDVPAGDTVVFGNTDTGLDFSFAVTAAVPEAATWAMLILGVAMIGFAARRRRELATLGA